MDKFSKITTLKYQNRYSEEFKRSMCQMYSDSNSSINSIEVKNKIGKGRLIKWLNEYGYKVKRMYLVTSEVMNSPKDNIGFSTGDVDQIQKLKDQLEQSRFEVEAYRKMIEIAERELNIDIRKKSATKR